MGDLKPDLLRLGELAAGLGLHQHLCLIYETQEEQFAAALPFLRSGLDRGEKCFCVADENSGSALLNALREAGIDVDRHVRNGALILARKPDVKPGPFNPDWLIGFLSQSIQGAGDRRFSGMRTHRITSEYICYGIILQSNGSGQAMNHAVKHAGSETRDGES